MGELDLKVCPFCAELIKSAAVVCRFCGRDLPQPGSRSATAAARTPSGDDIASGDPAADGDTERLRPAPQPDTTATATPDEPQRSSPARRMDSWKAILLGAIVAAVVFLYLALKGD